MRRREIQATVAGLILWTAAQGPLCSATNAATLSRMVAQVLAAGGASPTTSFCRIDSTLGEMSGLASDALSTEQVKGGYAGQLYDVATIRVEATPPTVNEEESRLLAAVATHDDDTRGIPSVSWSVTAGPIVSVDPDGTVHAGAVYQDTPATVEARHPAATGAAVLTVVDTRKDNYGSYGLDGIADSWQVLHFGVESTQAAAAADPDEDGQNNEMEFAAGTMPTNRLSLFRMQIGMDKQANRPRIVLDPAYANRSYTLLGNTNLRSRTWTARTDLQQERNGSELILTDLGATNSAHFYKASITYDSWP